MTTLKFSITLLLFILPGVAICQPVTGKTYAETKREKDNKANNDAYINNLRTNTNSNSNNSGGVNKEAAKQLTDQWSRNSGKMSESDKEYWRLKALADGSAEQQKQEADRYTQEWNRAEAQRMRYVRDLQKREDAADKSRAEMRKRFMDAGFTIQEAYNLAYEIVPAAYISDDRANDWMKEVGEKVLWSIEAYKQFVRYRATLDYQSLKKLAAGFNMAAYTQVKAQQYLGIRFPEKEAETELAILKAIGTFHGKWDKVDTEAQYRGATPAQKNELAALFLALYEKHPQEALEQCYNWRNIHPVHKLFDEAVQSNNQASAIQFAEIAMQIPSGIYDWGEHSRKFYTYLANIPGYLDNKPVSYWTIISKNHPGGASAYIQGIAGIQGNINVTITEKGKIEKEEVTDVLKTRWLPVLKTLAEGGNASAMNALGVLISWKAVKKADMKDAFAYWQKAADAGNPYAHLNLLRMSAAGIKGSPDKTEVMNNFMKLAEKSSAEELYQMALIIKYGPSGDMYDKLRPLGKALAEGAVEKGHNGAYYIISSFY